MNMNGYIPRFHVSACGRDTLIDNVTEQLSQGFNKHVLICNYDVDVITSRDVVSLCWLAWILSSYYFSVASPVSGRTTLLVLFGESGESHQSAGNAAVKRPLWSPVQNTATITAYHRRPLIMADVMNRWWLMRWRDELTHRSGVCVCVHIFDHEWFSSGSRSMWPY